MRKIFTQGFLKFVVFLELLVLFFVFLLYLFSSPQTLEYVFDRATQKLDLSYDSISGNFLKTITINNLRYHDKLLAQEAQIDWNIRALIQGEIEIETLSLQSIDINNIKSFIETFDSNSSQTKSSSDIPEIRIAHLSLSTRPYHDKYVDIRYLKVDVYDVASDLKSLRIKNFTLDADTNYAKAKTDGFIQEEILHLKHLSLQNIDVESIQAHQALWQGEESNDTTPFTLLKAIDITEFDASLKPYTYDPYIINSLVLKSHNLYVDLENQDVRSPDIMIKTDTNAGKISLQGALENKHFQADSRISLSQKFFKRYTTIIDFESLNPLKIHLYADQNLLEADLTLQSKQIFAGRYKEYFTDIKQLKSHIVFDIQNQKLDAITDANLSTKYADTLILHDTLSYHDTLKYGGTIDIIGEKYTPDFAKPLFTNAQIKYTGDSKDLVANLQTDKVHLLYEMYDFKRADFHLTSKELDIKKYFPDIPTFLHPLKASCEGKMSLDFDKTEKLTIATTLQSNFFDFQGDMEIFQGKTSLKGTTTQSQNSFIKEIDKNIKTTNIFPANLALSYVDDNLSIDVVGKNTLFHDTFFYDTNTSQLDNQLHIAGEHISLSGHKDALTLKAHINSLKTLQEQCASLYTFEKKPYDGEVEIQASIHNFENIEADIQSKWLVYEYTLNRFAFAEKIKAKVYIDAKKAILRNYRFNTYLDEDRAFYATKPSTFNFNGDEIEVKNLWINDQISTKGGYNLTKSNGIFHTNTHNYHYKGKEGDIHFDAALTATLSPESTHIEGKITVNEGLITYEHKNTHDIQDPDIIIIQEEEERLARAAEKKNNLSLDISIISPKPLNYKTPKVDVFISPDIKIWKVAQKEMEMLGQMVIHRGLYVDNNKEFQIKAGEILFGGEMLNPFLNINAQHTDDPYVIEINIAGTLDSPIINFSSNPFLSQSDILSMLLFSATTDSLFAGSSNSSNQALSMLGNTFAKEIVKNFGLTLDKLVISTNEAGGLGIEIGKKISRKVTVIYINDIVQAVKVRYQHSERFETDLMYSPESTGIDFIYKSEH